MWQYNYGYPNELYHHGVLGMKWGVRKYRDANGNYTTSGKKKYLVDKTAKTQRDIDSFKPIKNGLKDKNGRILLSKEDVSNSVNSLKATKAKKEAKLSAKWDAAAATQAHKAAIDKTTKEIDANTSRKEKFLFNEATRKRAAKYVVDNNMSVADATKKAHGAAWRNTAIFVGAYGAYTAYTLHNMH